MLKKVIVFLGLASLAATIGMQSEMERSDELAVQNPTHPDNPNRRAGHELSDMKVKVILALAIAMFVGAGAMYLGLAGSFFYLKNRMTSTQSHMIDASLLTQRELPPAPRLQRNPPAEFQTYREQQDQYLKSYGWIDRKSGVVRIPIERAMEILLNEK
jgi:hypothetical protein